MKHKMWSRLLSMALAVMMIVSIVPNSAFAEAANEITSTSQVQEIPAEETQTPEEVTVPEAETPAEPSTEPAPTEEPVAEPTAEPTVEPTAEPTQAPAETVAPSEQPSAEPTAAPEATETPNASAQPSETPAASATPAPSETPEATEEPKQGMSALTGEELVAALMQLDDEALIAALDTLTDEQASSVDALEAEKTEELFARLEVLFGETEEVQEPLDFNAMSVEELYAYLQNLSNDDEYFQVLASLTAEQYDALMEYTLQIAAGEVVVYDPTAGIVPSLDAAPLITTDGAQEPVMRMARTKALGNETGFDTTGTEPVDGLSISKRISSYDAKNQEGILTLEAYVTGEVTTTTKTKPLDIVLVLDQSGSMGDNFGAVQYRVLNYTNGQAWSAQGKSEKQYVYYDGAYYLVTISRTQEAEPSEIKEYIADNTQYGNIPTGKTYYAMENDQEVELEFKKTGSWYTRYSFVYAGTEKTFNGLENKRSSDKYKASNGIYTKSIERQYIYQYSVTVDGNVIDLGSSKGANGIPPVTLYQKRTYSTNGSRLEALKTATSNFIDMVSQNARETGSDHRVAIVGFASGSHDGDGSNNTFENTELFIGSQQYQYGGNSIGGQYQNAFQSVNTSSGLQNLHASVNSLGKSGATWPEYGFDMANNIFAKNPVTGEERQRIIVFFTDGEPGNTDYDRPDKAYNDAIAKAYTSKNTYGAVVYSIGVFSNANGTVSQQNGKPYVPGGAYTSTANRFMHAVSSNYPTFTATGSGKVGGWKPDGIRDDLAPKENPKYNDYYLSYYLSASNADELNQAFQSINDSISSPKQQLDETTVLYDEMSPYVALPNGVTESDIKIHTETSTNGGRTWSRDNEATQAKAVFVYDGETPVGVKVDNFDYSENHVVDGKAGKKLVVEIPFTTKDESYGGNNLPTNADTSGIYDKDGISCVGNFTSPTVNVPVNYKISAQDQTIHLTQSADLSQLMQYFDSFYTPDGVKNQFVTITYTLMQGNKVIATLQILAGISVTGANAPEWVAADGQTLSPSNLTDCTPYTISCTVTPVERGVAQYGNTAVETPYGANSTVHVLYPTVQAKDKYIALGESTDFDKCWAVETNGWYDADETHTNRPDPTTAAPTVTDVKVQEVGEDKAVLSSDSTVFPKQDTDYNIVEVKLGNDDSGWITDPNKFKVNPDRESVHNTNGHDCIKPTTDSKDHDFTIHVYSVNGDLIITKSVKNWNSAKGNDAAFVFKIEGGGKTYYCTINLNATNRSDSETITLPAGTYTVTELPTAGYKLDDTVEGNAQERSVVVSGNADDSVKFTNTSNGNKTPGDNSSILNKWLGNEFAQVTSEAANG